MSAAGGDSRMPTRAPITNTSAARPGSSVHYCAEQFENDGSPVSTIVKGVKRAMAGEYSRELSSKVFQGACRLIQLGFKQGGTAGFGLRRMLVDQNGQQKAMLKMGEQKSLQTDRVILGSRAGGGGQGGALDLPGVSDRRQNRVRNRRGCSTPRACSQISAGPGPEGTVHQVLTNEKYIGNNVYHRTSFKLKTKHVTNSARPVDPRGRRLPGHH